MGFKWDLNCININELWNVIVSIYIYIYERQKMQIESPCLRKYYTRSFTFNGSDEHLWLHDVVRLLDYGSIVLSNCDVVSHREWFDLVLVKLRIVHAERRYHELPALIRILNHEDVIGLQDAIENLKGRLEPRHRFLDIWLYFFLSSATNLSNVLFRRSPSFIGH